MSLPSKTQACKYKRRKCEIWTALLIFDHHGSQAINVFIAFVELVFRDICNV